MRRLVLVAIALSLALPVAAQEPTGQQPQKPRTERQVGTTGAGAATVEMVVDNPEQWYDKTVTLTAEVADVVSQRAFRLQEEGVIDVDDQLLVLWPKSSQRLTADRWVKVTGKVQRFNRATLEREHNITDWSVWGFDENVFAKYNDKPVLVATRVEMTEAKKK